MPIYEYKCVNGHQFEVLQQTNDEPLQKCKLCEAEVKKIISGFHKRDKFAGLHLFHRATGSRDLLHE